MGKVKLAEKVESLNIKPYKKLKPLLKNYF